MKNRLLGTVSFFVAMSITYTAAAWDITGGETWENRTGPGVALAIGGNTCTDEFCDSTLDVKFVPSIAVTPEFYYRLMPNLVVYGDVHIGYLNTNYYGGQGIKDDKGMIFQVTAGGAFHAPITGWLDAYVGLGLGYALLRFKGHNTIAGWDEVISLRGVNTELKIGADVYPISAAPTFGAGLLLRLGFTAWPRVCHKQDDDDFECEKPKDAEIEGFEDLENTPFLVFLGLQARYGF